MIDWLCARQVVTLLYHPAPLRYHIEVKTSDVRGAGTDANVTVQVFGLKGDTGVQKLDDSKNNFERDMLDNFFFRVSELAPAANWPRKSMSSHPHLRLPISGRFRAASSSAMAVGWARRGILTTSA